MTFYIEKKHNIYAMDASHPRVATVSVSDTVVFETMDCFSDQIQDEAYQLTELAFESLNPSTGPIYIREAKAGDTLAVTIEKVDLNERGVCVSTNIFGGLSHRLTESQCSLIPIKENLAQISPTLAIPLNPMVGVIGTAPAKGESILNGYPGEHGGNMDTKEIKEGSTVYLPVNVDGALLSLGDLHAAMADGETSGTGIEIAGHVSVTFELLHDSALPTPSVINGQYLTVIASSEQLDQAVLRANEKALDYLVDVEKLDVNLAVRFLSLCGDIGVSQIVNPLKTAKVTIDLNKLR